MEKDISFSKNFTLLELTTSPTAKRLKIDNTPNEKETEQLKRLCVEVLQPIRDEYKGPIVVTSGFRCQKLNKAVGGVSTSQHAKGEAADITIGTPQKNKELFNLITKMIKEGKIKVGQLIDEYDYRWLHISIPYTKTNQILHLK